MSDAVWRVTQWNTRATQGPTILQTITSDHSALQVIFGTEGYANLRQTFDSASLPSTAAIPDENPPLQVAVPSGTGADLRTAVLAASSFTIRRGSVSERGPPAKRRRTTDVIDLTTP